MLPLQLDLGDHVTDYVIKYQPAKLQALEGNWTSTNTGYDVFAIPDMSQQKDKVLITIPKLGSYIAKDLSGNPPHLACYSPQRLTDPICGPCPGASG